MAKSYIKLWDSYESYFEPLGAAEVGRLVLAMMQYKSSGVAPEFSGSEKFIWPAIKRDLDEDIAYTARQSEQVKASRSKHAKASASKCKQVQVPASDCKCVQADASESNPIKTKDVGLRTKDVGSRTKDEGYPVGEKGAAAPSRGDLESRFGSNLAETVSDWLSYKAERREAYKQTGLKSLLSQIENKAAAHGDAAVAECIRTSMANGWRGIIWDRMQQPDTSRSSGGSFADVAGDW